MSISADLCLYHLCWEFKIKMSAEIKKYLIDERRKLKEIHQSTKYAENLSNTTNFKPSALITKKLQGFQITFQVYEKMNMFLLYKYIQLLATFFCY